MDCGLVCGACSGEIEREIQAGQLAGMRWPISNRKGWIVYTESDTSRVACANQKMLSFSNRSPGSKPKQDVLCWYLQLPGVTLLASAGRWDGGCFAYWWTQGTASHSVKLGTLVRPFSGTLSWYAWDNKERRPIGNAFGISILGEFNKWL